MSQFVKKASLLNLRNMDNVSETQFLRNVRDFFVDSNVEFTTNKTDLKINLYSENEIYRNFLSFHDLLKLIEKINTNFKTSKLAISGQRIELKKFIEASKKILKSSSSIEVIKNKMDIMNDIEITKKNTQNFEIIDYQLEKDMYTLSSYMDFNE